MKEIRIAVAALLAAALPFTAAAQGGLPDERTQGDVTYVSGGAQPEQADALRHAAAQYPLAIELRLRDGAPAEYIAEARIEIRDAAGNTVFDNVLDGPLLLARLPAGTYTVSARWRGMLKQQTVDLTRPRTEYLLLEFAR
jgi:hypothetical protein